MARDDTDIETELTARGLTYAATNVFESAEQETWLRAKARENPAAPFSLTHYKPLSRIDIIAGVMRNLPARVYPKMEVRAAGGAGDGLFAAERIAPGTFVGEYTGRIRVILQSEVQARGDANDYLFTYGLLGPFMHEGTLSQAFIDAHPAGNHTRFANHSFKPNCASGSVLLDDGWHVFLAANRVIEVGEQIVYDYGAAYWSTRKAPLDI